jgi:hypothetical protein
MPTRIPAPDKESGAEREDLILKESLEPKEV